MDTYSDRREFVRMPSTTPVQVSVGRKHGEGTVIDISPGGCQLVYAPLLEKGKKVKIEFTLVPGDPSVEVLGDVMWVKPGEGDEGHRYGIQFKEREKFEKLGPMFLDYLTFKKKMDVMRKEKRKENLEGE